MTLQPKWIVDTRNGQRALVAGVAVFLGIATFGVSLQIARTPGLPIDDAWIFQTFARNLAQYGEVAFNHGIPATGASSSLWLLLLAPGYLLPIEPLLWTHLLTMLGAIGAGWMMLELAPLFIPREGTQWWAFLAAVLVVSEWHLVWSALAGMETPLFTFLSLLLVYLGMRAAPAWLQGIVGGLLIVTRVEGVLLVGLIWLWNFKRYVWRDRILMALSALVVVAPMLWVNWHIGGLLLPNTWAAKLLTVEQPQSGIFFLVEYAVMLLIGVNVLLIPAIFFVAQAPAAEKRPFLLPFTWIVLLLLTYVVAFPIVYHHLRYMMPTLPWWVLLGVAGTARVFLNNRAAGFLQLGLTGALSGALAIFGMYVYAWNVQNVNGQHVAVGKWLGAHTPVEMAVAAEDIGAIGYFSGRAVVDIQGLVTPEVLPLLRAGKSLVPFLCAHSVEYLAVYPRLYPRFANAFDPTPSYQAHLDLNTINPDVNLNVYKVERCSP